MIQLVAMILISVLMLIALRDIHIIAFGLSALVIGSVAGLASSGILGEVFNGLKPLKVSKIMGRNRKTIQTSAGVRAVQVILLPEPLKLELDRLAKVRRTSVSAIVIEAIHDRLWLESVLATPKAPISE